MIESQSDSNQMKETFSTEFQVQVNSSAEADGEGDEMISKLREKLDKVRDRGIERE